MVRQIKRVQTSAPAIDHYQARWRGVASNRQLCRARNGHVKPVLVANGLEPVGQADHGLRRAEHEEAVAGHRVGQAVEQFGLRRLVEIDEDVAAEDQIERPQMREIGEQVELLVLTMRRISGAICQASPNCEKCLISSPIGSPRCTSNWL